MDVHLSTLYSRLERRILYNRSGNRKVIEFKRFGIENIAFSGDRANWDLSLRTGKECKKSSRAICIAGSAGVEVSGIGIPIAYQNKRVLYGILFRATAETLHTIASDTGSKIRRSVIEPSTPELKPSIKRHHSDRLLQNGAAGDGFYEWRKTAKPKLPFALPMKDGRPFTFAGFSRKRERSRIWRVVAHLHDYYRRA